MIPYLIRRGLPHVDISSALQMMLLNLLAHLASVRVLAERWPTFPAKARGNVPAPPRGILSRARRLRSEACAGSIGTDAGTVGCRTDQHLPPKSRGCSSELTGNTKHPLGSHPLFLSLPGTSPTNRTGTDSPCPSHSLQEDQHSFSSLSGTGGSASVA